MIANILGLGMSFLCGIFVPQAFLGNTVLAIGRFLPAYWYVRITNMFGSYANDVFSASTYWMCIGACLACVCQSKDVDHHSNVHNKRICKDGPVFLAEEVEL